MIPWKEFLTDREIFVLENWPAKTYKAIGQDLGVSPERVRQIRVKAERKIREEPIKRRLQARLEAIERP